MRCIASWLCGVVVLLVILLFGANRQWEPEVMFRLGSLGKVVVVSIIAGIGAAAHYFPFWRGEGFARIFQLRPPKFSRAFAVGTALLLVGFALLSHNLFSACNSPVVTTWFSWVECVPALLRLDAGAASGMASTWRYEPLHLLILGLLGGALFEEFVFRGYLANVAFRGTSAFVSGVASAFAFAVGHASAAGMLPHMLIGFLLFVSVRITGSIWLATLLHAAHNAPLMLGPRWAIADSWLSWMFDQGDGIRLLLACSGLLLTVGGLWELRRSASRRLSNCAGEIGRAHV